VANGSDWETYLRISDNNLRGEGSSGGASFHALKKFLCFLLTSVQFECCTSRYAASMQPDVPLLSRGFKSNSWQVICGLGPIFSRQPPLAARDAS